MTESEQNVILAGLVRERRELRTKITCLQEFLRNAQLQLRDAHTLLNLGSPISEKRADYPGSDELNEELSSLRDAEDRLTDINKKLDG